MSYYTYLHRRESDNLPFYIGKGQGRRAWAHKGRNPHWERTVAKHGLKVEICAEWSTEVEAFEHEKFLIACFRDMEANLCNKTDGGDGASGMQHTPEEVARIKRRVKNQWATQREKMMASLTSDDTRQRISEGTKKAFAENPKALEKLSAAIKASWADPAKRKMRLDSFAGGAEKLSASLKEYYAKPENRKKQGLAIKAGQANPETKAKMSEGVRKRFEPGGDLHFKIRKVVCVETGKIFENQRQAALWASAKGVGWMIGAAASGKRNSAYGHTWKFIEKETA